MTDNDIIKALDGADVFLRDRAGSKPSPLNEYDIALLLDIAKTCDEVATIINCQKAEIEKYEKTVGKLAIKDGEVVGLLNGNETAYIEKAVAETLRRMAIKTAKAEAIKEFAERLIDMAHFSEDFGEATVCCADIDDLAKEMTEETT